MGGKHYEIERKYLIRMPDEAALRKMEGCEVWEIEQIYLVSDSGMTRRIRRVAEGESVRWYRTFKQRITHVTCAEDEGEITEAEYCAYRREADPELRVIEKIRYRIPYEGQLLEIDVYPFWTDRAVLEIELDSEDTPVSIPEWIGLVREVTEDRRYKNVRLADEIPMDEL